MKKFYIEVTETLQRIVSVEAMDLEDAMDKVQDWAGEGEGLTYEDFVDRDFEDVTKFCEGRDTETRDAFFDITVRDYKTLKKALEEDIDELYERKPNIPYEYALKEMTFKEYFGHEVVFLDEYAYPNGKLRPVALVMRKHESFVECYIAINKHNKIQVVKNMTEVK